MPTESEFRDQLRGGAPIHVGGIDTDAVIRRARRRRAPRQLAIGSVAVLAVAGFTVLGVSLGPSLISSSSGSADSAAISDAESQLAGPESPLGSTKTDAGGASGNLELNLALQCGDPVSEFSTNPWGLVVTTSLPDTVSKAGERVMAEATLTNTGASRVHGTTPTLPTAILARDGVAVWRTSTVAIDQARSVDLSPGESLSYVVEVWPRECTQISAPDHAFSDDRPLLGPGPVEVIVGITFVPDGGEGASGTVISGPAETVTLR